MEQQIKVKNSRPHGRSAYAQAREKACISLQNINVLIACEESQAETEAFRTLGYNAFSCDIQPCRKGHHQEWHILGDVTPLLHGENEFITMDGTKHCIDKWHLIIAHPPCTYLTKLSAVQLMKNPDGWRYTAMGWKYLNVNRWEKLLAGRSFFITCLHAIADYVAVENPIPMKIAELPPPDCYACPSWFGVKYTKKTLYWTKNLPPLVAKIDYANPKCYVQSSRGKYRSRTFPQLAQAIAEQWGSYICNEINKK